MRRLIGTPKELVHNNVFNPSVSKAAVRQLAANYVRSLSFYRRCSLELQLLLAYCSREQANDVFRYEDFAVFLAGATVEDPQVNETNLLRNRAEFQAVFRFLHPNTRLAREEIPLAENQSLVLVRYGTDQVIKQDGTELSYREFESFPAFRAAAANMRATLALPADQPLKDLFSQNDLVTVFTENPANILVADGILVEKSALIDMINGFYDQNRFYNSFHYLPPFHETEIPEATLAQLPAETAEKVRAAKREYLAAQNHDASLEFLNGARAILLQMADAQRDGNIFLPDQQAEGQLGGLNQDLVLLFARELESQPQLAAREIEAVVRHYRLRLSLSAVLQEQPCIKLRQIYLWKFLYDNRARFPADQPLVVPPLVNQLCAAENYNFAAMFSDAPRIEMRIPEVAARPEVAANPIGFFQAERPELPDPLELDRINDQQRDFHRAIGVGLAGLQNALVQLLPAVQAPNGPINNNPIPQLALGEAIRQVDRLIGAWILPRAVDLNDPRFERR